MQESLLLFTLSHNYYLGLSSYLDKKSKDIEEIGFMSIRYRDIAMFKVFGISKPFLKTYFSDFEYFYFDFKERYFTALNSSVGILNGIWMDEDFSINDDDFCRKFYSEIKESIQENERSAFFRFCFLCYDVFNNAFILPSNKYFGELSLIFEKYFPKSHINIFFLSQDTPSMVHSNCFDEEQVSRINKSAQIISGISDIYLHSGQRAGHLNDLRNETLKPFYSSQLCNIDTTVFLSLYHKNSFYGAILIDFLDNYTYFANDLLEGLSAFLSYITLTNNNMKTVEELVIKDRLTGLPNYRYFKTIFSEELERSFRFNYPLGIGLLEIKGLMVINSTFGYEKGDVVVRDIAGLLSSSLRKLDALFRFSDNRFAMLLPNVSEEFSEIPVKRISSTISKSYGDIGIYAGFLVLYPSGKQFTDLQAEKILNRLLENALRENEVFQLAVNK